MRRVAMTLLCTAACSAFSFGAVSVKSKAVSVGEDTYYLRAGTDVECRAMTLRDGSDEVTCQDGANKAVMNSTTGCLSSAGDSFCSKNIPYREDLAGSHLNCPDGNSYSLTSGVPTDENCFFKGDSKICATSDGDRSAQADCKHGCGNTRRNGTCCKVGVPGCMDGVLVLPARDFQGSAVTKKNR